MGAPHHHNGSSQRTPGSGASGPGVKTPRESTASTDTVELRSHDATRRYLSEIGVTRERVRQIQLDALKNLRAMMESHGISGDTILD